jgi:hypothetical protein
MMKKTCTDYLVTLAGMFAAAFILSSPPLLAQELPHENPALRRCDSFKSAADFVGQASAYCLKQQRSFLCDQEAATRFKACRFKGDFHQIHRRALTNALMLFLISNSGKKIPEKFDDNL